MVQERLSKDNCLDADKAVEWALLNNPNIRATFEELGIAHAGLIEAGLLTNPSFSLEVRYPETCCFHTNIEYLITGSLLDLFLRPIRVRVAEAEYEKIKFKVAQEILDLAFEVRATYYAVVFEKKQMGYIESSADLGDIQAEVALRQKAVGNINALDQWIILSSSQELQLEWRSFQNELQRLQEKLNRLLGCACGTCWKFPEEVPETLQARCGLESLQEVAISQRFDLRVAEMEVERLCKKLGLHKVWAYTNLSAGVAGEREPDGENLVGFGLSGDVPIFNYGQAARSRLYAELRQAIAGVEALQIQIFSEVREAFQALVIEEEIIRKYQEDLLAVRKNISQASEELYDMMNLGVYRLLELKQQEMNSFKNYYGALKRYWMAKVELEKALGTSWGEE